MRLFISHNTVKNHVRAVLDKLHAGDPYRGGHGRAPGWV